MPEPPLHKDPGIGADGNAMFIDLIHAKKKYYCAKCKAEMLYVDAKTLQCPKCGQIYTEEQKNE